jgi:hypothetical protein
MEGDTTELEARFWGFWCSLWSDFYGLKLRPLGKTVGMGLVTDWERF